MMYISCLLFVMVVIHTKAAVTQVWTSVEIQGIRDTVRIELNEMAKKAYDETTASKAKLKKDFEKCKTDIAIENEACNSCSKAKCTVPRKKKTAVQKVGQTVLGGITDLGNMVQAPTVLKGIEDIKNEVIKAPAVIKPIKNIANKVKRFWGGRKRAAETDITRNRVAIMEAELKKKDSRTQDCYKTKCVRCYNFVSPDPKIIMGAVCGDSLAVRNSSLYQLIQTIGTLKKNNDAGFILTKIVVDGNSMRITPHLHFKESKVTYVMDGKSTTFDSRTYFYPLKSTSFSKEIVKEIWERLGLTAITPTTAG